MSGLWRAFQCRVLNKHRWQPIEVEGERALECRDCRTRVMGNQAPDHDWRYLSGG